MMHAEEANNGREEPTGTTKIGEGGEKEKPELVCMEEELEKWSTQPVTDFAAYGEPLRCQIALE